MPDFDPENIPTLDDVIEHDGDTEAMLNADADDTAETAKQTEETVADDDEDTSIGEPRHYPENLQYSVQISYQEVYDKFIGALEDEAEPGGDTVQPISADKLLAEALQANLTPAILESAISSVVKSLVPDMEQQLRFLLQRSLEEKLSDELISVAERDDAGDTGNDHS